jgi:hypothetical protein
VGKFGIRFFHEKPKLGTISRLEFSMPDQKYRMRILYRKISLRHNLSRKCRKIVKVVSITHSERSIRNGPIVATAISWEKRIPVLEGNGCLADRA